MTRLPIATFFLGLVAAATIGSGMGGRHVAAEPPTPAEQRIRDALDGGNAHQTGDGVLDDVLEIIKNRGSILDGSPLDDVLSDPSTDGTSNERLAESMNQRALAAEQLLRTARLLAKTDPVDATRKDLVARMRTEAVRLLTQRKAD